VKLGPHLAARSRAAGRAGRARRKGRDEAWLDGAGSPNLLCTVVEVVNGTRGERAGGQAPHR